MKTAIESWAEWRAACALVRCGPEAQADLKRFAVVRFAGYLERAARAGIVVPPPSPADCWHRFESHFALNRTLAGKSYKRWLFDRIGRLAGEPLAIVESGASLIAREVVRVFIREERFRDERLDAPRGTACGAAGDGSSPAGLTLADLLTDAADTREAVAFSERRREALALAGPLFDRLDRPRRMALVARGLDCPFSDPELGRASGLGKSRLYQLFNHVVAQVVELVNGRLPDSEREERVPLGACLLDCLIERAVAWARLEISCANLFKGMEGRVAHSPSDPGTGTQA